jgi:hypothetical protein
MERWYGCATTEENIKLDLFPLATLRKKLISNSMLPYGVFHTIQSMLLHGTSMLFYGISYHTGAVFSTS